MIEPNNGVHQPDDDVIPCSAANPTSNTPKSNDSSSLEIDEKLINCQADSDSLNEKSFEIIAGLTSLGIKPEYNTMEANNDGHNNVDRGRQQQEQQQAIVKDVANKPRSNSDIRSDSVQSRVKKSRSFLSKLQASQDDKESSNIVSTSIVNAFSSFSSFTSNFTLNNTADSIDAAANQTASSLTIETASTSTRLSQVAESREDIFSKKATLERKNLISLTKLIVKDLISSSLSASRTIDDCQNAVHLNNYFTLIDRVLKHGLKQNILSNKSASLWAALDSLPKYLKESTLMSESVRSLANTKTPDGKIKAWMRLAMMQKKLPEYFNELLANKNVLLKDIYHDFAFMLNDEAQVFAGLIIGVNVIDCNFFVKDANFDSMDDIIDLSPYLRAANSYDDGAGEQGGYEKGSDMGGDQLNAHENVTAILDQKNYLEEWNKRLESTVGDLQAKIKTLEEQNSKLEMEAKVSEARILKLQGQRSETPSEKQRETGSMITDAFKSFMGTSETSNTKQSADSTTAGSLAKRADLTEQTLNNDNRNESNYKEESRSDLEQTSNNNVAEGAAEKQGNLMQTSATNLESKTTAANNLTGPKVVMEDMESKRKLAEQEKELATLKERTGILEASYRGALEKIKTLERDLDIQTSMNADKETTIKMYERDIREKQAQVESLRVSLNDSKKLNSDLNERLNDTSAKLKDRIKIVSGLQESLDKWKLENRTLATRLQDKQTAFKSVTNDLEKALASIVDLKRYNEKINEELKRERESGQSSSVTLETQTAQISKLTANLGRLEAELDDVRPYKDTSNELTKRCREYEQSLEEIGVQLRESRLEVENLRENSAVFLDSQWMDSKSVRSCVLCEQSFSVTRRKHHCRLCGNVFCQTCSDNKMELASSSKPVRVCDTCHSFLLAKFVKSASSSSS